MKSFNQYLSEARPTGQKRYQRDTAKLETRLDKMYAAGGSQKKIDRAEMRLAKRTGEGDFDVEDINARMKEGQLGIPLHNEDDPRTMSVEDLMRMHGSKVETHGMSHREVGSLIRNGIEDIMIFPVSVQPNVTDEELGIEAHKMALERMKLIQKIKSKGKK
jgi:hypothetical protein